MPIYTYHCENCGIRFDQYQKFTDEPLTICPECNEIALHKVYQPVGIVFKGKGFYSTDNRSPSGQTTNHTKHETESGTKPDSADVKSQDSAPKIESTAKTENPVKTAA